MHSSLPDCCVLLNVTKDTVSKIIIAKPFSCSEKRTGKQSASVFPHSSVVSKHLLGITFIRRNFQEYKCDFKKILHTWLFLLQMLSNMNWQKGFYVLPFKENNKQLQNSKILTSKADLASACNPLSK